MTDSILSLAILDDLLSLSPPHFVHIPQSKLLITTFTDTLPPASSSAKAQANLLERLKPFAIISTVRERTTIPNDVLRQLPNLRLIIVTGTHRFPVDVKFAQEIGIEVAVCPGTGATNKAMGHKLSGGNASSTTQQTWALILGLSRGITREHNGLIQGSWQVRPALNLSGKIIGLFGLGRLGGQVGRIAVLAFGMKVIAWSSSLTQEKADEKAESLGLATDVDGEKVFKVVSKEELFQQADVLSVHYGLSQRSVGLIRKKELDLLKKDSILVNTSRGPIIDEKDLIDTLGYGKLRGVGLDVFNTEPLPKDHVFRSANWGTQGTSELLLSPHMGYVEEDVLNDWYAETADHVTNFLK